MKAKIFFNTGQREETRDQVINVDLLGRFLVIDNLDDKGERQRLLLNPDSIHACLLTGVDNGSKKDT